MAATRSHRYLGAAGRLNPVEFGNQIEFDEADIWGADDINNPPEAKKQTANPSPLRKPLRKVTAAVDRLPIGPKSVPVSIPDWSKILGGEYAIRTGDDYEDDGEEEEGNDRMPPHVYLARARIASFSVHEGVGRTLKGRDLSRVRNAIWKQTGFED